MLEKAKEHINKILVFALNLLLMIVALLMIKEKDQARLSEKKQNDLLNDNSFLSNENSFLKDQLQSLKGIVEEIKSIPASEDKNLGAPDNVNVPAPSAAVSKVVPPPAAPIPASVSPPAIKSAPASNSKTKTS